MSKTLSGLLAVGIITAVPAAGYPCRDFEFLNHSQGARLVAEAEAAMEAGRYREVLDLLDNGVELADWRHGNKRMELVAIANIRSGRPRAGVLSLRYLLKRKRDDPYLLTRLAEGLARTKHGKVEAVAILESLEKSDLITDAEGYAVLAELRRGRDEAGAQAAAARCRAMTTTDGVCPELAASS